MINKKNNIIKKTAFSLIEVGVVVVMGAFIVYVLVVAGKRMLATAKCSGAKIEVADRFDTYSGMFENHNQAAATLDGIDEDKAFKDCIAIEMGLLVQSTCSEAATAGSSGSYLINGENIYCDMVTDGGGWALIAVFSNNDGILNSWTSVSNWQGDAAFGDATLIQKADAKSPGYLSIIGNEVMIIEDIAGDEGKMKYNLIAPFNTQPASDWFSVLSSSLSPFGGGNIENVTLTDAGVEIGSASAAPHWAFSKQATELVMKQRSIGSNDGAMLANNPGRGGEAQPGVGIFIDTSFTSGYPAGANVFKDDGVPHYTDPALADHTVWLYVR